MGKNKKKVSKAKKKVTKKINQVKKIEEKPKKEETIIYVEPDDNDYSSTDVGRIQSFFDGKLIQLLGYKILGIIVTIVSLGILYPLSYCMIYKWKMKHTVINGTRLMFDGKWYQLWKKWIIWILLSIVTLGIYSLWIPVKKNKWILKHTHYSDTNVDEENNLSDFDGSVFQLIGCNIVGIIITILSFGLLLPCYVCLLYNWKIKHTIIDGNEFEFDGRAIQLFGLWIKWFILSVVTLGIYSLWIPVSILKWEKKHTNRVGVSEKPYSEKKALVLPILFIILIAGFAATGIFAYKDGSKNPFKGQGLFTDDNSKLKTNLKLNL